MSKYKNYIEFREQFGEYSVADHVILSGLKKEELSKEYYDNIRKNGLDCKVFVNGTELNFSNVMKLMDKTMDNLEAEAKHISDREIEEKFITKVSDKLYDIINKLDDVDKVVKGCITYDKYEKEIDLKDMAKAIMDNYRNTTYENFQYSYTHCIFCLQDEKGGYMEHEDDCITHIAKRVLEQTDD